jgi:hypothetical protein
LNIRVGASAGSSLAAREDSEESRRLKAAEQAIEQDEFIKNLKQDFGAEVMPASIRPANS